MRTVQATGTVSPVIVAWQSLSADPLVSVRECAATFAVDPSTIRRWVKLRKLRAVKVGGQLRVRQSQVLGLMQEMGEHNAKAL
jgi:excisionase family DNA binding protein